MVKRLALLFLSGSLIFCGCIFRRPVEVKKEYYDSGNLKIVRKIYKKGERIKYYTDGPTHHSPKGK